MTDSPSTPEPYTIQFSNDDLDGDGYVTIWNLARASCGGSQEDTRELAAKLLLFLCKKQNKMVVISSGNAEYLDDKLERDKKILNDWKPESEYVDILSQHAEVPASACVQFLTNQKFNSTKNYTATRAQRLEWFQEMWSVG